MCKEDKKNAIIEELTKLKEGASYKGAIPEISLAENIAYARAIRIVEHHLSNDK